MEKPDHCIQSLRVAPQGDEGGYQTQALFIAGVKPLDGLLPLSNVRARQAQGIQHIAQSACAQRRGRAVQQSEDAHGRAVDIEVILLLSGQRPGRPGLEGHREPGRGIGRVLWTLPGAGRSVTTGACVQRLLDNREEMFDEDAAAPTIPTSPAARASCRNQITAAMPATKMMSRIADQRVSRRWYRARSSCCLSRYARSQSRRGAQL
jgi:hypothetical protein